MARARRERGNLASLEDQCASQTRLMLTKSHHNLGTPSLQDFVRNTPRRSLWYSRVETANDSYYGYAPRRQQAPFKRERKTRTLNFSDRELNEGGTYMRGLMAS